MSKETGPRAGVSGIVEDVKGKAKEAVGAVGGDDALRDEGRAQQEKAGAQRDVATKEAEADAARARRPPARPSSGPTSVDRRLPAPQRRRGWGHRTDREGGCDRIPPPARARRRTRGRALVRGPVRCHDHWMVRSVPSAGVPMAARPSVPAPTFGRLR